MPEFAEMFTLAALGWGMGFAVAMLPSVTAGLIASAPVALLATTLSDS